MKRDQLVEIVKGIIAKEVKISTDGLDLKQKLIDLDIDSLDVLKLALALERYFNITITTAELEQIQTVDDIITGLEGRLIGK